MSGLRNYFVSNGLPIHLVSDNMNNIDCIPCHIYLMSDQPIAASLLTDIVGRVTHCTSTTIGQDDLPKKTQKFVSHSSNMEHWKDLALSIHAWDRMISYQPFCKICQTSTLLIRELVKFQRTLEHHYKGIFEVEIKRQSRNVDGELTEFKQCINL